MGKILPEVLTGGKEPKQLAARVRIHFFGVPVYEGEWTKNGTPARYDRDGKFPWWQDRDYGFVNINTATAEELAKLPGIKGTLVSGIIEKRPFLAKEEIGKRVSGIGKKTYEQIEGKICVR